MATAEQQLKSLWDMMSPLVEQEIRRTGTFPPLGGTLRSNGLVEAVLPATGADASVLLRTHLKTLAASRQFEAIGMASRVDAQVPESAGPVSGILYQFDNAEGVSQATFLPYRLDPSGTIAYGELHGQEGDHALFGGSQDRQAAG